MTDPRATLHFFNLNYLSKQSHITWVYDLLLVFPTVLVVHSILFYGAAKQMKKPVFSLSFNIPTRADINLKLMAGSALFGIGWALGGFCPGPSLVAAFTGDKQPLAFIGALYGGFLLAELINTRSLRPLLDIVTNKNNALLFSLGTAGLIAAGYFLQISKILPVAPLVRNPIFPFVGAGLIAVSVGLMMILNGQVLGLSGIASSVVLPEVSTTAKLPRFLFIASLLAGGAITMSLPQVGVPAQLPGINFLRYPIGGLLVGLGTSLANGCTSGHGICGTTRLSARSLIATATFFGTAILVASVANL